MGDLKEGGALWNSLSADKDGWVAPAILSAAREIQGLKNSFGNLNMRSRGLQAGETVVRVRASACLLALPACLLACLPVHRMHACHESQPATSLTKQPTDQTTTPPTR